MASLELLECAGCELKPVQLRATESRSAARHAMQTCRPGEEQRGAAHLKRRSGELKQEEAFQAFIDLLPALAGADAEEADEERKRWHRRSLKAPPDRETAISRVEAMQLVQGVRRPARPRRPPSSFRREAACLSARSCRPAAAQLRSWADTRPAATRARGGCSTRQRCGSARELRGRLQPSLTPVFATPRARLTPPPCLGPHDSPHFHSSCSHRRLRPVNPIGIIAPRMASLTASRTAGPTTASCGSSGRASGPCRGRVLRSAVAPRRCVASSGPWPWLSPGC
jgi:hypothetical protein